MIVLYFLMYALAGAAAGVLAGLLGVGGGIVIVPVLSVLFAWQGMPGDYMMQLALGTSLASIMFTSVSSMRAHHAHGAVRWNIVKLITPGILIGTLAGSKLAAWLSSGFLKGFFICFLYYVSVQMFLNFKPKPSREIPGLGPMTGVGGFIGVISALVGIGGGTLTVPFMTWCNVPMHQAVGTGAAIGFPIAVAGTIGFILGGMGKAGLPEYTWGFVYLPALVGLVVMSMITAPTGAKIAHKLPVAKLKKVFAGFLFLMATRMLFQIL
ncbi:MAG: sulfite exporter TauE/SafE family protein [Thermodesulfobacteriota bacterium]